VCGEGISNFGHPDFRIGNRHVRGLQESCLGALLLMEKAQEGETGRGMVRSSLCGLRLSFCSGNNWESKKGTNDCSGSRRGLRGAHRHERLGKADDGIRRLIEGILAQGERGKTFDEGARRGTKQRGLSPLGWSWCQYRKEDEKK